MEEPTSATTDEGSPARSTSLIARLMNVVVTPGEVFDEVKAGRPSMANWLVPLTLAAVIGVVYVFVIFSQPAVLQEVRESQQKQFQKQVAAGKMTQEQADKAAEVTEKFMTPAVMKLFGILGAVFGNVVWLFLAALGLWLLGKFVFKGSFSYLQTVEVTGLEMMIAILGAIISMLLVVVTGNMYMTPGPALLIRDFDAASKIHQMLSALNFMTFWYISVLAIGLARLSGTSFTKAGGCLFGLWAVFKLGAILVFVK
jgi:Yip1-like protein